MNNELMDSLVGIRALRHRRIGGAMAPCEEVWDDVGRVSTVSRDDRIRVHEQLWAIPAPFTLGLSHREPARPPRTKRVSWALRNQDYQPTCIAHAVVACIELMQLRTPPADMDAPVIIPRLSVRFLYQQMRELGVTDPPEAEPRKEWKRGYTRLENAMQVLKSRGICTEKTWPDSGSLSQAPCSAAKDEAKNHLILPKVHICYHDATGHRPDATREIIRQLQAGLPVAIALPAFAKRGDKSAPNNWTRASVLLTGQVIDPTPDEKPVKGTGHAVCIVGFLPDASEPLGGYFVFRNSMGEDFASLPPPSTFARGYGRISASHVDAHCWELLSLDPASTAFNGQ